MERALAVVGYTFGVLILWLAFTGLVGGYWWLFFRDWLGPLPDLPQLGLGGVLMVTIAYSVGMNAKRPGTPR